ncbi:hypothetical protein LCGC14_2548780 [marine sediment metagenome]|uniref:Uncharacterized protein n=1 Tax=marine sediment metagenome TaxID=412755 RepID=A0A0F9CZT4_9ZZZZ
MTQQTNGMPELKYSEETFRVMYEALDTWLKSEFGVAPKHIVDKAISARAKAEGK